MNKYHISYTVTVEAENYEEAYQLGDDIIDFVVEAAPEELGIEDIHSWAYEADMDNEEEN